VRLGGTDDKPQGNIYHLKGSIHEFGYEKLENKHYQSPGNWKGTVNVGKIARKDLPRMEKFFEQVAIVHHDGNWGCRKWVSAALRKLCAQGFKIDPYRWQFEVLENEFEALREEFENR